MSLVVVHTLILAAARAPAGESTDAVEQWGTFELVLRADNFKGNGFTEVRFDGAFESDGVTILAHGFYDGDHTYRLRFMPDRKGAWTYRTTSNLPELDGRTGQFTCVAPGPTNRGPVSVRNVYHFAYADGSPFVPIGTTSYGWVHQPAELQERTLATLKTSPFNKVRMSIFPSRSRPKAEKPLLPFPLSADGSVDRTRFDPAFFRNLETRMTQLADLGIEADLILFHPYDDGRFGLDQMEPEVDDRYARYVVARLAAYRNVWWSMANEFDLLNEKSDADWARLIALVQSEDPYGHLRSIHHSQRMYDPSSSALTHLSVQNGLAVSDFGRAVQFRNLVHKPIVFDEVHYEGNASRRWGQLSGEEMTLRFWMGTIAGTYVGHGEAIAREGRPAWLSAGGELVGTSPSRIAFLKSILRDAPPEGIEPIDPYYETHVAGKPGEYYLIYFGREKPTEWTFDLPRFELRDGMQFKVDVIDTWNMNVEPLESLFTIAKHSDYIFRAQSAAPVRLPGRPYMAVRVRRVAQ